MSINTQNGTRNLASLLDDSARLGATRVAVNVPGKESLTYGELLQLSNMVRDRLHHLGVHRGDRVGIRLHKSIDSVAAIFGILKAGAAYVPVDAESPAARGAFILHNCEVKVVITDQKQEAVLRQELQLLGTSPVVLALDRDAPGIPLRTLMESLQSSAPVPSVESAANVSDDIAYILYTSGSTGRPKGVVLTHQNAASFIDWCSRTFQPGPDDVFSSHAPFHFDLSILDIFVSIKHGARLVLFEEALGKEPIRLASSIASERITIWYSTPSILNFLTLYGKLDRHDFSSLRMVFFAGEVFPVPQFRALKAFWAGPRYFNLYGPTETNVCTFYEVPDDSSWQQMNTFPIGTICPPNRGMVVDEHCRRVAVGEPGQLIVSGTNVMTGYWNLPEQNAQAFFVDEQGARWYQTGDVVVEDAGGQYRYLNRRDRMVKRRGYRVELGEIEAGLVKHENVREAAVIAVPDNDAGVRIVAFVSCRVDQPITIIGLKAFASKNLPSYMIPDAFSIVDALPRTSTNKVDLQALKTRV